MKHQPTHSSTDLAGASASAASDPGAGPSQRDFLAGFGANLDALWDEVADQLADLDLDLDPDTLINAADAAALERINGDEELKRWSSLEQLDEVYREVERFIASDLDDLISVSEITLPTAESDPVGELVGATDAVFVDSPTPFELQESTDTPDENDTSGVVKDEVVLALLKDNAIRLADVYAAIRRKQVDVPLWRALVDLPGIDRDQVLAEAAAQRGFSEFVFSEETPTAALFASMRESMPGDRVDALISRGAVPVDVGIAEDTNRYRIVLAAADPGDPILTELCKGLPMDSEVRFARTAAITRAMAALLPTTGIPKEEWPDALPAAVPIPGLDHASATRGSRAGRGDRSPVAGSHADRASSRPWPKKASNGEDPGPAEAGTSTEAPPAESPVRSADQADASQLDKRIRKDRVVSNLVKKGLVTPAQLAKALERHAADGGKEALWRALSNTDGVNREAVFAESARVYAFPEVPIGPGQPDHEFVQLIMQTIAEDHRDELLRLNLLPYEYAVDPETGGARLIFVTHDPARADVHRTIAHLKLGRFELRYASERSIADVIVTIYPRRNEFLERMTDDPMAFDLGTDYGQKQSQLIDEDALEAEISRSTLINLFEAALLEGVRQGASDIHVFPNNKRQTEIHFRVDGRLRRWLCEDKIHPESFLAVVKDNSMNVDRFERDMAQDGYIQRRIDDALIRFRVSVLPIASANQEIRAESIVIRILDDRKVLTDLRQLGMLEAAMERMDHAIRQPHGMVILTGPTGSGKSTTLVAALYQVVTPEVNVLTIEDPVEYIISGVRQIKLGNKLDLEGALRAVLRHDPDVVMVGEMRDRATAELAIKLANTGHLTFSTLHTNDAPAAVSRLYKMGVEPFLIAYAINLIVAQRLIRTLCQKCKVPDTDRDAVLMKNLGFKPEEIEHGEIFTSAHDPKCSVCAGKGFKGRRAISETLSFSPRLRHTIAESGNAVDEEEIRRIAIEEGMLTLQDSARILVLRGETSVAEMLRTTASE